MTEQAYALERRGRVQGLEGKVYAEQAFGIGRRNVRVVEAMVASLGPALGSTQRVWDGDEG